MRSPGGEADGLGVDAAEVDGRGGLGVEAEAVVGVGPEEEVPDNFGVDGVGIGAAGTSVGVLGGEAGHNLDGGREGPGLLEDAVDVPLVEVWVNSQVAPGSTTSQSLIAVNSMLSVRAEGGGTAGEGPADAAAEGEDGGRFFLFFGVGFGLGLRGGLGNLRVLGKSERGAADEEEGRGAEEVRHVLWDAGLALLCGVRQLSRRERDSLVPMQKVERDQVQNVFPDRVTGELVERPERRVEVEQDPLMWDVVLCGRADSDLSRAITVPGHMLTSLR